MIRVSRERATSCTSTWYVAGTAPEDAVTDTNRERPSWGSMPAVAVNALNAVAF